MGALTTEERKGVAAVLAQTATAVVTFFVAKDALFFVDAAPLVLVRAALAGILVTAMLPLLRGFEPEWRRGDLLRLCALGILVVPLNQALFFRGLERTSAAHAALLFALTPAIVLVFGVLRRTERLTVARAGGIAIAFAGVALVLAGRPPTQTSHTAFAARQLAGAAPLQGDLLVLVAVISWAAYTAFSRDVVARLGSFRATAGALGFGALAHVPFGLAPALRVDWAATPANVWIAVAWLVIGASALSYLLWYYAIRRLDPSRVAVFTNLQPLGTALVAWALGARPSPAFFGGAALVIGGVLLAQRGGHTRARTLSSEASASAAPPPAAPPDRGPSRG